MKKLICTAIIGTTLIANAAIAFASPAKTTANNDNKRIECKQETLPHLWAGPNTDDPEPIG